jgi:hypothetical protein
LLFVKIPGFCFRGFLFPLPLLAVLGNPSGSTLRKSGGAEEKMKWGGAEEKKMGWLRRKTLELG